MPKPREILGPADFAKASAEFAALPDHALVLVLCAYVEHALEEAVMRLGMPTLKDRDAVFGQRAPVSSFYAKATVAEAFGIVGPNAAKDLDLIREVRNSFAHSGLRRSIEEPDAKAKVMQMAAVDRHPAATAIRGSPGYGARFRYMWTALFVREALLAAAELEGGTNDLPPHLKGVLS